MYDLDRDVWRLRKDLSHEDLGVLTPVRLAPRPQVNHQRQPVVICRMKDPAKPCDLIRAPQVDSGVGQVEFDTLQSRVSGAAIDLLEGIRLQGIEAAEPHQTIGK